MEVHVATYLDALDITLAEVDGMHRALAALSDALERESDVVSVGSGTALYVPTLSPVATTSFDRVMVRQRRDFLDSASFDLRWTHVDDGSWVDTDAAVNRLEPGLWAITRLARGRDQRLNDLRAPIRCAERPQQRGISVMFPVETQVNWDGLTLIEGALYHVCAALARESGIVWIREGVVLPFREERARPPDDRMAAYVRVHGRVELPGAEERPDDNGQRRAGILLDLTIVGENSGPVVALTTRVSESRRLCDITSIRGDVVEREKGATR